MKKVKLIYNPNSGDTSFKNRLDFIVERLQKGGCEVTLFRTPSIESIYDNMRQSHEFDYILASGGDGTLNHVINAMLQCNINLPIGIFPSGTANDFAGHLGIPKSTAEVCDIILNEKTTELDIGKINDRYFVNVASAGLLTDVSQKIDINLKNTLGKMAYYIKGIEQFPNFKPIPVRIKYRKEIIEEMVYLILILNGSNAGGFKLAPDSTANDGMLNLVAIKACSIVDLFNLFIKMLKGDHLGSSNVIYLRGREFAIECYDKIDTDIDGEIGPSFPLNVGISDKKIRFFIP